MEGKKVKKFRKVIAVLLSAILTAGSVSGVMPVNEQGTRAKAEDRYMLLNRQFEETEEAYFELTEYGEVTFEGTGCIALFRILDYGSLEEYANNVECGKKFRLPPGEYKAAGAEYTEYFSGRVQKDTGKISKINFVPTASDVEQEFNDTFDTAYKIDKNAVYVGNLNPWVDFMGYAGKYGESTYYRAGTYDVDCYKFELEEPGLVQIQYSIEDLYYVGYHSKPDNINTVELYDESGDKIASLDSSERKDRYSQRYRMPKGIYYILISGSSSGSSYGDYYCANLSDYQLRVNYEMESPVDHEQEYNNAKASANEIQVNTAYTGNIPTPDDKDYYKFSIPAKSKVSIKLQIPRKGADELFAATLYKADGISRITETATAATSLTARSTEKTLEAGEYYVAVYSGRGEVNDSIDYELTVSAVETEPDPSTAPPAPTATPQVPLETPLVPTATPQVPTETPQIPTETPTSVSYMPLNRAFEAKVDVYFELPKYGMVSFEDCNGETVEVCIQPLLNDGSLGSYDEFIPETKGMNLKPGKYLAEVNYYGYTIAKINFTPAPDVLEPSAAPKPTAAPAATDTPWPAVTEEPTSISEPDFDYVKSITLSDDLDDDEQLVPGSKFCLYADVEPEELEDVEIEWEVSDERVASVKVTEDGDAEVTCIGAGTVTITASTTDGSQVSRSKTYTVSKAKSSNNYLARITKSQGKLTPAFKKTRTSYSLVLKKNMSQAVIRATAADKKSTIKIDKKKTSKVTVKLKRGKSKTVRITVTAENGKSRVYKIKVKRK